MKKYFMVIALLFVALFTACEDEEENEKPNSYIAAEYQEEVAYNYFFDYEGFGSSLWYDQVYNNPYKGISSWNITYYDESENSSREQEYDRVGRRTHLHYSNNVHYDYSYYDDYTGNSIKYSSSNEPFERWEFTYDKNWQRLSTKRYDYDSNEQLSESMYTRNPKGRILSYDHRDYEDNTSITERWEYYNETLPKEYLKKENGLETYRKEYTIENELVTKREVYEDQILTWTRVYTYDSNNRVTGYTETDSATGEVYEITFTFLDGQDLITQEMVYEIKNNNKIEHYRVDYSYDDKLRKTKKLCYDYTSGNAEIDKPYSYTWAF